MTRERTRLLGLLLPGCLALCACSHGAPTTDAGVGIDAGVDAGLTGFVLVPLDSSPQLFAELALAVSANDHVGVAYFVRTPGEVDAGILLPDGGVDPNQSQPEANFAIRYVEWWPGLSTPVVQQPPLWDGTCAPAGCVSDAGAVQLLAGIAVAFQQSGQPVVAYMGGPNVTQSPYWFQQNATLNFRAEDGASWTEVQVESALDINSPGATAAGRWPALAVDPADGTVWFAYRTLHEPMGDLRLASGQPADFLDAGESAAGPSYCGRFPGRCPILSSIQGDFESGSRTLVVGPSGAPFLAMPSGAGSDITFFAPVDGGWAQTDTGLAGVPALAWQPDFGFLLVALNFATATVGESHSTDGNRWSPESAVFAYGSGGFWPSVDVDPTSHRLSVAFVFCSQNGGTPPFYCSPSSSPDFPPGVYVDDDGAGSWEPRLLDEAGIFMPQIGHLSTGMRVVAYQRTDGSLWLAVESPE